MMKLYIQKHLGEKKEKMRGESALNFEIQFIMKHRKSKRKKSQKKEIILK